MGANRETAIKAQDERMYCEDLADDYAQGYEPDVVEPSDVDLAEIAAEAEADGFSGERAQAALRSAIERPRAWRATHEILRTNGTMERVMLVTDGAGYTREEWEACAPADYERAEDGSWTFQGQAFNGSVRKIAK